MKGFADRQQIQLPADMPPQLLVVIDTEEEFDWNEDPDRAANSVYAMEHIDRAQSIFNEYGIVPCYVIDYPVASKPEGHRLLRQYHQAGQCEIGAHLHPWVNPPFDETLSRANMYPGNLDREIEYQKLEKLRNQITEVFGEAPRAYKAGRYGFGPHTREAMKSLGFDIDLSVCPPVDYRADGGPDYRGFTADPFWFDGQDLLEIPVTGAFIGWAGSLSGPLFEYAQKLRRLKAPGVLSRLSAVDRLMLSPEGFTAAEHRKLTGALFNRGLRTFTWSFHSPSVVPDCTPYTQTEKDVARFLDDFRRYFDYFFQELGGQATTPTQLRQTLETLR